MGSGWQAQGMRRQACRLVWSAVHAQKGVLHGINNTQNARFLQNQARGPGWHAEADWLMVKGGPEGSVTSAGEGF